ncbi:hypothetical protein NCCP1664_23540 [Zafaria cholistanensis]|uniref:Spermatogenesis-associated protein 20-like TRX domain-containing protein n=1 Tax=Zafaria cholistanensis TaxID=1682741 RepID=A0A5A7NT09_9MICC|nr:DUF255 domain-containing protein [Zafaria cholistanensis]GER23859.1 hypothetical protein NCCP1664_23540 [Zafaria cholistanensis]
MADRIAHAASAYLRQHAHQPVDWWPFGPEAFAAAAERDVPVFLSIGYAACHWCHVMAAESFDDPDVAAYLNAHFVPVKVDREERPDVDAVYMAATQTLTGQGGWPMSVFALPDGRTIHAGTYYPPFPRPGVPAFRQVLEAVVETWTQRREELLRHAGALAEHIGSVTDAQRGLLALPDEGAATAAGPVSDAAVAAAVAALARSESADGGFSPAPKFPPSSALDFLLQCAASGTETAAQAAALADRTLEAMALSALYDQVGGGFARYCVDARWRVPHFEKMLYDNAQLLRHYARWAVQAEAPAHRALGRRVAQGTAAWLAGSMVVDGPGLASSLDADTVMADGRHVEGGTYLFTRAELAAAIPDEYPLLEPILDGEPVEGPGGAGGPGGTGGLGGDLPQTLAFARLPTGEQWRAWDRARPRLERIRAARPQPGRDAKVVAAWNGLAVQALAQAGLLLGEPGMVRLARDVAGYLWRVHWAGTGAAAAGPGGEGAPAGRLARVSYDGRASGAGMLEDYAAVALGFQAVAAATGGPEWIRRAGEVLGAAERLFLPDGQPRDTTGDDPLLATARGGRVPVEPFDGVVPGGVGLLAAALLEQAGLESAPVLGNGGGGGLPEGGEAVQGEPAEAEAAAGNTDEADRFRRAAARGRMAADLVRFAQRVGPRAPGATGTALAVALRLRYGTGTEVVAVGGDAEERERCRRAGLLAGAVLPPPDGWPAAPDGSLRVYLCRGGVCASPFGSAGELEAALAAAGT